MSAPKLYIVVPCYNEEQVLPITAPLFLGKLMSFIEQGSASDESRVLFVNDGSRDDTWDIICELSKSDSHYCGLSLSRNRGHQNALLAGLMEASKISDVTISIDCDGQDDFDAMDDMLSAYQDGCEIVYGVRSDRKTDTFFKKSTAQMFYKLLNSMGVEAVYNHADYRLMSSRALCAFAEYKEVNLFLRGMVPLVGFKSTSVLYSRKERMAGESHYPLSKMISLAVDGITSLSIKPIRLISALGLVVALLGLIGLVWAIAVSLGGGSVEGWGSTIAIVCFMGGVQLLGIGVIGEYIGKIYLETKHRPRYTIDSIVEDGLVRRK